MVVAAARSGPGLSTRSTGHVGPARTMPSIPLSRAGTGVAVAYGSDVAVAGSGVGVPPAEGVATNVFPAVGVGVDATLPAQPAVSSTITTLNVPTPRITGFIIDQDDDATRHVPAS